MPIFCYYHSQSRFNLSISACQSFFLYSGYRKFNDPITIHKTHFCRILISFSLCSSSLELQFLVSDLLKMMISKLMVRAPNSPQVSMQETLVQKPIRNLTYTMISHMKILCLMFTKCIIGCMHPKTNTFHCHQRLLTNPTL